MRTAIIDRLDQVDEIARLCGARGRLDTPIWIWVNTRAKVGEYVLIKELNLRARLERSICGDGRPCIRITAREWLYTRGLLPVRGRQDASRAPTNDPSSA
jgi:hypothetical protein